MTSRIRWSRWIQRQRLTKPPQLLATLSLFVFCHVLAGCGQHEQVTTSAPFDRDRVESEVNEFCGACHVVPKPELFSAKSWVREVERGYGLYAESGRTDLDPPKMHEAVEFYRSRAPAELNFPTHDNPANSPLKLQRIASNTPASRTSKYPAISSVYFDSLSSPPTLVYGDMRSGEIMEAIWTDEQLVARVIGQVANPARIHAADLDLDGQRDWLVADLGNFLPAMDHYEGAVYWLRKQGDRYESIMLAENLGRVADVQAADFDQDGDIDLVVAEFGWHSTGRLLLLRQTEIVDSVPKFEVVVLDQRHGSMHVPVLDANGDGLMDFIVLFSQEYESVELFLNRGNAKFERQVLFEAGAPSYGSSGIDLVDLDGDGDIDVLLTNGDAFDSSDLRPYHQVQWLENDGNWSMTHHSLTVMPGAHRALAVDLDLDGDLDVVAVALLPDHLTESDRQVQLASTIWLEQTSPGKFLRRDLDGLPCNRAALAVGDIDGDNAPDIIVGEFQFKETGERAADLTVWRNRTQARNP